MSAMTSALATMPAEVTPRLGFWGRVGRAVGIRPKRRMLTEVAGSVVSPGQADTLVRTPSRPAYEQEGVTGTRISGGRIWNEEPNSDLIGVDWPVTCAEMIRTDATVAAAWRAVLHTLLSAKWRWVAPDGASPSGQAATDFLNEAFGMDGRVGRMEEPWERQAARLLRYYPVGHLYAEEIYYPADGRVWLRRFVDCDPVSHSEWVTEQATMRLAGVRQRPRGYISGGRLSTFIPANKLILLTNDQYGSNFEGVGALRPAYYAWKLKQHALSMLAVACERWAVPTPHGQTDHAALALAGYNPQQIQEMEDRVADQLKNYTSHELGYLLTPKGFDVKPFGGSFNPAEAETVIRLCNGEILRSVLVEFLSLGTTDVGSRSVGEVHSTFFRRACVNILDQLAATVGGEAGPGTGTAGRLLAWNFPGLRKADRPRLTHEGLDEGPLLDMAGTVAALIGAGAVTPRDALENALLKKLGAPPLGPGEARDAASRIAGGAAAASPVGYAFTEALKRREAQRT